MATKWSDIYSGETYQSAPPEEQEAVRKDYFNKVIAPQVKDSGDDVDMVWNDFQTKYPTKTISEDTPIIEKVLGKRGEIGNKLVNKLSNVIGEENIKKADNFVNNMFPQGYGDLLRNQQQKQNAPYNPKEIPQGSPTDVFNYDTEDTQLKRMGKQFGNYTIASNPLLSLMSGAGMFNESRETYPAEQEKKLWDMLKQFPKDQQDELRKKYIDKIPSTEAMSPLEDPISSNIMFGGALRGLGPEVQKGSKAVVSGLKDALAGMTGGASDLGMAAGEKIYQKIAPSLAHKSLMKKIKNAPALNSILDVPVDMIEKLDHNVIRSLGTKTTSNNVEEIAPYINRLSERLGQEDAEKLIRNNLDIIEHKGESHLLNELSEAVYRKETIGKYGSVTDIVNKAKPVTKTMADGTKFVEWNKPPVYEAELNMLKDLPQIKKQGFYTPSNRIIDELGGSFKDVTYRRIQNAEHLKNIEYVKDKNDISKLRKEIGSKSSERIGIYAVAQQKNGNDILKEMGKTVPELTPRETAIYDSLRDKYEKLYIRLNEARIKSGVKPFDKVDNYFTFFKSINELEKAGLNPVLSPSGAIDDFIKPNSTPFAFSKKRTRNDFAVETDALNVFNKYNHAALNHIYVSPEIAKTNALNRTLQDGVDANGKAKTFLLKEVNPNASEFIEQWSADIAGKKFNLQLGWKKAEKLDKIAEKINKNLVYSVLSYNFDSAAKQLLALRNTMPEVGLRNLTKGIELNMSPSWRKFALNKSAVLNSRFFESGIEEALSSSATLQRKVGNAGITPLKLLDAETARVTWLGAYNKELKETKNFQKAIDYADDVVIRTQGSASKLDRAPISRTPTGKAFSLFQTFAISDWQYLKKDVLGIGKDKHFNAGKLTKYIIGTAIANKIYNDGLGMDAFPNPIKALDESATEGNSNAKIAFDVAMEMAGVHPIFGSAKYGFSLGGSAIKTVGNSVEKLRKGKDLDVGGALLEFSKLAGAPGYGQAKKIYDVKSRGGTWSEALHGQYPKNKKDDFKINGIKGDFKIK